MPDEVVIAGKKKTGSSLAYMTAGRRVKFE